MSTFAHQGNGKLIKGPGGKFAKDCVCCGCTCPNGYRIVSYSDGLFTIPNPCSGNALSACPGYTAWDGTFAYQLFPPACTDWYHADPSTSPNRCISGTPMATYGTPTEYTRIGYNSLSDVWAVFIILSLIHI